MDTQTRTLIKQYRQNAADMRRSRLRLLTGSVPLIRRQPDCPERTELLEAALMWAAAADLIACICETWVRAAKTGLVLDVTNLLDNGFKDLQAAQARWNALDPPESLSPVQGV